MEELILHFNTKSNSEKSINEIDTRLTINLFEITVQIYRPEKVPMIQNISLGFVDTIEKAHKYITEYIAVIERTHKGMQRVLTGTHTSLRKYDDFLGFTYCSLEYKISVIGLVFFAPDPQIKIL